MISRAIGKSCKPLCSLLVGMGVDDMAACLMINVEEYKRALVVDNRLLLMYGTLVCKRELDRNLVVVVQSSLSQRR